MIRLATSNDIKDIQNIAKKSWAKAYKRILSTAQMQYMLDLFYSTEALSSKINDPNYAFYVYIENNQPLGFIQLIDNFPELRLEKIYILPNQQGKGIGKKLIDFAKENTINKKYKSLQLNVNRFNSAVKFYDKLNFLITKEEDNEIGNGYYMNDYVMEWYPS